MASSSAVDASSFRKLTHREHVLLRPEMYIGSVAVEPCAAWVVGDAVDGCVGCVGGGEGEASSSSSSKPKAAAVPSGASMVRREGLAYSPGLLKVFDEIVVNAIDHSTRTRSGGGGKKSAKAAKSSAEDDASSIASGSTSAADPDAPQPVKKIQVSIDQATGIIEVSNDGDGIPVEKHEKEGVYVPELIFGHLLTSANYDDAKDGGRIVGGQNGIGAKACNIMSQWFEIEVIDRVRHLRYRQKFEKNMEVVGAPKIDKSAAKKSSLTVRFLPDYVRLGMTDGKLSDDMAALMRRRVWDATAVTEPDVAVWLDGKKLEVKSFERYVDLYVGGKGDAQRVYEKPASGWEIAAALSDGSGLQQISFVNGVATLRGGKHTDHIVSQISKKLCEMVATKRKIPAPKPQYVKDNLIVFVRATIPGPRFDSQSKETLTTPVSQFGGKIEVSDGFVEKLYKIDGLVDRIVNLSGAAVDKEVKKTDGAKRATVFVPKLDDATLAGTNKSDQCTLILTEGDSAKASAIAGLSVVGRDKYGVFPLRGKVLNVGEISQDKIAANAEITAIKKILGLQIGKEYRTTSDLRYGRIMLMCDADSDGSHIKGLIMNLFLILWPSLLKIDGFITTLLTPIVKVWPGGTIGKGAVKEFFNIQDYEKWREENDSLKKNNAKFYKGLGTSTSEEARDWFKKLRIVAYTWDQETSKESILKAFCKKRADDRKEWLKGYDPKSTLDYGSTDVSYKDFIEKDLIHHSNYDVLRSIPSAIDGLKVSQRKVMFGCFKRNLVKGELRVAQLAAYVGEVSCYHHGEASLQGTIVNLAQDYVGSGMNTPLLLPIGQFGSRINGGDDWASPRYIHTRLRPMASKIFPKDDEPVLNYLDDDGITIEPDFYVPVIPLVLVNGALGIGTGYSTTVPSYDPNEVVDAVRKWMGGTLDEWSPKPWYRGFLGTIEEVGGKLRSRGVITRIPMTPKVKITELPIGYWTEDFKTALEGLVESESDVKGFVNESTDVTVSFTITFSTVVTADAWMAPANASDPLVSKLESTLKMVTTKGLSTTNMHLFSAEGRIKKYDGPKEILDDFCTVRLKTYEKRKAALLARLRAEEAIIRNRVKFIEHVIDGSLVLHGRKENDEGDDEGTLENEMLGLGLQKLEVGTKAKTSNKTGEDDDDGDGEESEISNKNESFRYLLDMPLASLTHKRKVALDSQLTAKETEIMVVEGKSSTDMWNTDLDGLVKDLKLA
jgi:DNA topoisomerase-2